MFPGHVEDVRRSRRAAVAQGHVGRHHGLVAVESPGRDVRRLVTGRQGPDLQETELVRIELPVAQDHGEFDLHLGAHGAAPQLQQQLQDVGQGEQVRLQDVGEGNQAHAVAVDAVVDGMVLRRVDRADRLERAVAFGVLQVQQGQVEVVVVGGIGIRIADVHGEELALAVLQPVVDGAELGQDARTGAG